MFISKLDADIAANAAKEIAKYAFALSFFLEYQNAEAEVARCRANLEYFTKELLAIGTQCEQK